MHNFFKIGMLLQHKGELYVFSDHYVLHPECERFLTQLKVSSHFHYLKTGIPFINKFKGSLRTQLLTLN